MQPEDIRRIRASERTRLMIDLARQRYALLALLAAALFGISTPLAKLLLGSFPPLLLAGLLYLGSGCGLLLFTLIRKHLRRKTVAVPRETPLARHHFLWLALAIMLAAGLLLAYRPDVPLQFSPGSLAIIGAAIAMFVLGEPFTASFGVALVLMVAATWLVLTEVHAHKHAHEYTAHSHRHIHDEHHQHAHRGDEGPEPHAHRHEHPPMTHAHPHLPDLHHRHEH